MENAHTPRRSACEGNARRWRERPRRSGIMPSPKGAVVFGHRHYADGQAATGICGRWRAFYAVSVETCTFLFTDIEGSTSLLQRVGQDVYARVLADHHLIIRLGLAAHGGREVDTQGDAF